MKTHLLAALLSLMVVGCATTANNRALQHGVDGLIKAKEG